MADIQAGNEAMIKIAVTGAAGRMGRTLIQAIQETPGLVLAAAVEQPGFSGLGADRKSVV